MNEIWKLMAVGIFLSPSAAGAGEAPYPPSSVITDIEWAATATQDADGSDLWPMTWADDDLLYTDFGDGWGFDYPPSCARETSKLSTGWATVDGPPSSYSACNIDSNDEVTGSGSSGKKAQGILSVDGVLYAALRNANEDGQECEIWSSTDHGINWADAGWNFNQLGVCAFLNFGKDYAGARDGFVYLYSPDTSSAYDETDSVVLARAPKDQILSQGAWEFFAGMNGENPQWSSDFENRAPVFDFPGGCNRQDVTYNAGIGRYLMTMRARGRASSSNPNHFSIFDAPEPWGPWTTVYYAEQALPGMSSFDDSSGAWGESQHIPSKWISPGGTSIVLVYSGDDSFRTREATLTLASQNPDPIPAPQNLRRTDVRN